VTVVVSQKF